MTAQAQRVQASELDEKNRLAVNNILRGLQSRNQVSSEDFERFRHRFQSAFWRFESFDSEAARPSTEAAEGAQRNRARILSDAKGILLEALENVAPQIGSDVPLSDEDSASAYDKALSEMEQEVDDIRNAIAVLQRYQEQHRLIADGLRHRLDIATPATSEGEKRARNLLWFDIFKVCCEALGLHYRAEGMSDRPGLNADGDGYLIQCIIRDAWEIYSGETASEKMIATEIRKQKKNKALRKKIPRSVLAKRGNRGSKFPEK
ncbi:hypothetical protein [Rhizobium laguerreae]|uniref:hypothetical protein n=1 Tax=Rhizobium laguerreae TaxID=1076926 RepID=UPI001C9273FD|nr:hypothetical protein [Rhizobium laguerreae]MBY3344785.1 hypothetical protein [Rhizobium laguerreae]MBY3351818.1 hypothetical protein [Rhizobium laguerreae]MBY3372492.1 hypothetical protein [Rhizobium laguerreae]MBY3427659.1 hypothetical protein [Rhizobium laguerreae]MBY3436669.1 hypothetical protein [Rhizobium laguerreae]